MTGKELAGILGASAAVNGALLVACLLAARSCQRPVHVEGVPPAAYSAVASAERAGGAASVMIEVAQAAEPRAVELQKRIVATKKPLPKVDPDALSNRAAADRWTDTLRALDAGL